MSFKQAKNIINVTLNHGFDAMIKRDYMQVSDGESIEKIKNLKDLYIWLGY